MKESGREMSYDKDFRNIVLNIIHADCNENGIPCTFYLYDDSNHDGKCKETRYNRLMTFQSDITKNYVSNGKLLFLSFDIRFGNNDYSWQTGKD